MENSEVSAVLVMDMENETILGRGIHKCFLEKENGGR